MRTQVVGKSEIKRTVKKGSRSPEGIKTGEEYDALARQFEALPPGGGIIVREAGSDQAARDRLCKAFYYRHVEGFGTSLTATPGAITIWKKEVPANGKG